MHASRTVGRTYCTKTIIHISQNKRGVAATLAYTYVGLKYVNNVVATIVHRYYFMINIVMVVIDSHVILVTPMKNRTDQEMRLAYLTLLKRVKNAGAQVLKHVLDNECSDEMREMIRMECKLEFVPPGCHRRNIAEAAIKNFKNHFVAILSGTDPAFPVTLWDKLLPQAELTTNLLRQSNTVPTVSAQAHLFGTFDFNRMPLAPMGCAVQVHEDADKRKTWQHHTVHGWYLATSPDHYRAHTYL